MSTDDERFTSGAYDAESEHLLIRDHADAVLVIVLRGRKGGGFSLSMVSPQTRLILPGMLRDVADQIEGKNMRREVLTREAYERARADEIFADTMFRDEKPK